MTGKGLRCMSDWCKKGSIRAALCLCLFVAVVACPFGIEDCADANQLDASRLFSSPILVLFALGVMFSSIALSYGIQFERIKARWPYRVAGLTLCLFLCLCAPSWFAVSFFEDVAAAHGYFGSNAFVFLKNATTILLALSALPAGVSFAILFVSGPYWHPHHEKLPFSEEGPYRRKCDCHELVARVCGFVAMCAGSLLVRQLSTYILLHLRPAIPALTVMVVCCATVSVFLLTWVIRLGLLRAEEALLSYSLGLVVWSALTRVFRFDVLGSYSAFTISLLVLFIATATFVLMCRGKKRDADGVNDDQEKNSRDLEERFSQSGLAPRECEIACLTARGATSREVADKLGIKPSTVRSAMQRAYKKLGVEGYDIFMATFGVRRSSSAETLSANGINLNELDGLQKTKQVAITDNLRPWLTHIRIGAVLLAVGCTALLPVVLSIGRQDWGSHRVALYCVSVVMIIVSCSVGVVLGGFPSRHSDEKGIPGLSTAMPLLSLACFIGSAWEELQRNLGGYPLFDLAAPVECGLVLIVLSAIRALGVSRRRVAAGAFVSVVVVLVFGRVGVWVLAACAFVVMMFIMLRFNMIGGRAAALSVLVFALSAIATDVTVNKYADIRWGNDAFTDPFGGREAFDILASVFVVACLCFVVVVSISMCRNLVLKRRSDALRHADEDLQKRLQYALLAYGVNETEVSVLLCIARGMDASAICDELCIARGTVNAARNAGYRALGIHNRAALIRTLSQHTGM